MNLADVLIGDPADVSRVPQLRQGIVTQVSPRSSSLVGAATTAQACNALASYTPTAGDTVSVLVISGDRLVLGNTATSSRPALGVMAVGTFEFLRRRPPTITNNMALTNPLSLLDRRPIGATRLRCTIRGFQVSAAIVVNLFPVIDGVNNLGRYQQISTATSYQSVAGDWLITGDGATHSYVITIGGISGSVTGIRSGSEYYIEDVGPVRP